MYVTNATYIRVYWISQLGYFMATVLIRMKVCQLKVVYRIDLQWFSHFSIYPVGGQRRVVCWVFIH